LSSDNALSVASVSGVASDLVDHAEQKNKAAALASYPTTRQRFGLRAALRRSVKTMAD